MIPLPVFAVSCTVSAVWCSALVIASDASAVVGFTLAAVNASAALLTGWGTWRMSNKRRERDAKVAAVDRDSGSGD